MDNSIEWECPPPDAAAAQVFKDAFNEAKRLFFKEASLDLRIMNRRNSARALRRGADALYPTKAEKLSHHLYRLLKADANTDKALTEVWEKPEWNVEPDEADYEST